MVTGDGGRGGAGVVFIKCMDFNFYLFKGQDFNFLSKKLFVLYFLVLSVDCMDRYVERNGWICYKLNAGSFMGLKINMIKQNKMDG